MQARIVDLLAQVTIDDITGKSNPSIQLNQLFS
jgi:hypothetical protein